MQMGRQEALDMEVCGFESDIGNERSSKRLMTNYWRGLWKTHYLYLPTLANLVPRARVLGETTEL